MSEISVLILVLVALEEHFHQIICLYPSVIQPFRLFQNCQFLMVLACNCCNLTGMAGEDWFSVGAEALLCFCQSQFTLPPQSIIRLKNNQSHFTLRFCAGGNSTCSKFSLTRLADSEDFIFHKDLFRSQIITSSSSQLNKVHL